MITTLKHIGIHNCKTCSKDISLTHPLTKYCSGCRKNKMKERNEKKINVRR